MVEDEITVVADKSEAQEPQQKRARNYASEAYKEALADASKVTLCCKAVPNEKTIAVARQSGVVSATAGCSNAEAGVH